MKMLFIAMATLFMSGCDLITTEVPSPDCPKDTAFKFSGYPDPALQLKENGIVVDVHREAELVLPHCIPSCRLYLTGYGVRYVKVLFVKIPVYAALSYVSNPPISKTDPLGTIEKSDCAVVYLVTFRDIDAVSIRESIAESMRTNDLDVENPPFSEVLKNINFNVTPNTKIATIGYEINGQNHLLIEMGDKQDGYSHPRLFRDFWRVWFGIPLDNEMAKLKDKLLQFGN